MSSNFSSIRSPARKWDTNSLSYSGPICKGSEPHFHTIFCKIFLQVTDGEQFLVENTGRKPSVDPLVAEQFEEILLFARAARGDDGHIHPGGHRVQHFKVKAAAHPVGVDAVEADFPRAVAGAPGDPFQGIPAGVLPAALGKDPELPVHPLDVGREDDALAAVPLGRRRDEGGVPQGPRVDRDLVGPALEHPVKVVEGVDAAPHRQRDEDLAGHLPEDIGEEGAPLIAGGDVVKDQLVGAGGVVHPGHFHRVGHVSHPFKVDPLDHTAVAHVQAGDDPLGDHRRAPFFSYRKVNMTSYEKVKAARSESRPGALDYISNIFSSFIEFHGDRKFGDDGAVVGGLAYLGDIPVTLIGIERGKNTLERISRSFGSPNPEGYRKAVRLMREAEKFSRPVVTIVDTSGAYCGVGAEERGQSEAIAESITTMMGLSVPTLALLIGEGGSGGALALMAASEVWMLENSVYSVISPEGCASILYKDASLADAAAENLRLTAQDALSFGICERIIPEDDIGSPSFYKKLSSELYSEMQKLLQIEDIKEDRYQRFRAFGSGVAI